MGGDPNFVPMLYRNLKSEQAKGMSNKFKQVIDGYKNYPNEKLKEAEDFLSYVSFHHLLEDSDLVVNYINMIRDLLGYTKANEIIMKYQLEQIFFIAPFPLNEKGEPIYQAEIIIDLDDDGSKIEEEKEIILDVSKEKEIKNKMKDLISEYLIQMGPEERKKIHTDLLELQKDYDARGFNNKTYKFHFKSIYYRLKAKAKKEKNKPEKAILEI